MGPERLSKSATSVYNLMFSGSLEADYLFSNVQSYNK